MRAQTGSGADDGWDYDFMCEEVVQDYLGVLADDGLADACNGAWIDYLTCHAGAPAHSYGVMCRTIMS